MKPTKIVNELLQGDQWARKLMGEASIHLPRRGKKWVASFTGPEGQQWKSTGTADPALARAKAAEFEAAAGVQRMNPSRSVRRPPGNRQSAEHRDRGLTQREVGLLLGLSERAVRAIEKRALRKLACHPDLREVWRQFLAGELTEQAHRLSAPEINALWGLTCSPAERAALRKALEVVQAD